MNIVITMAGLGSRFKKAGYNVPKYMIEVKGKSLFEWSMISLQGFQDIATSYIFIVRKEDNSEAFIKAQCKKLAIKTYHIVPIQSVTDGQATTVMLASQYWKKEEALMIYNIDTYVEVNEMNSSQIKGDGFIPCFNGEGDHWSFVKVNDQGIAVEVREKDRISEHCTLGAYYFKTCGLYENLYNDYYSDNKNLEKGEKYVAPLYNYLISKGGQIFISSVGKNRVNVLGTPEELEIFKCKNNK